MDAPEETIFYFCWALIINLVVLGGASFIRFIPVTALWLWFGVSVFAYVCYEALMPVGMNIRVDLLVLWPLFGIAGLACTIRSCLRLFNWFRRPPPEGVHSSEAAANWASSRFEPPIQPIAAYVAHTLHEQLGIELSDIEPSSTFTGDLDIDWGESMEVILAIEQDLAISIPADDPGKLNTVTDLVHYLHVRLFPKTRNA